MSRQRERASRTGTQPLRKPGGGLRTSSRQGEIGGTGWKCLDEGVETARAAEKSYDKQTGTKGVNGNVQDGGLARLGGSLPGWEIVMLRATAKGEDHHPFKIGSGGLVALAADGPFLSRRPSSRKVKTAI